VSPVNGSREAESLLLDLAAVFVRGAKERDTPTDQPLPHLEAKYRTLVEQLPAVVFMAYLDRGIGEAYVSPRIEEVMGFSQAEWLEDPVRWYHHIHPDDRERWSIEAAEMFMSGKPLRSAYRVLARDGRVVWFQCEVKMVRGDDGRPWFIHGVGFDVTDLKTAEAALQGERNLLTARAQPPHGHSRHRGRGGRGAGAGRHHHPVQSRRRDAERVLVQGGGGALLLGPVPRLGGGRAVPGAPG
jgi:PAS domain S-box-containing protein